MLAKGDVIVAFNPVMDFSSSPLTVGSEYTVEEYMEPSWVGGMAFVRLKADNGRMGTFDLSRFKSREFYDKYMSQYDA